MKKKFLLCVFAIFLILALVGCGVTPNQPPIASFTANPTSGVAPLEVSFNASGSSDPDGNIVSYEWDFEDGDTGSGEIINHTFSSTGSYKVELTVTDNKGATDSTTKSIIVTESPNQPPIANFTANPTSGVVPLEVSFNASSSFDSDGFIVSYAWDFKDGNTGTGLTINHTFSSAGSYNVKLTVTDDEGATDSITKTITVTEAITFCEIGVPYIANDGLTVTLNNLVITEKVGSYQYTIDYTLTNNMPDKDIYEGAFKMYYKDQSDGLPQYGFFGKLFPGDTINKTYTFEELKSKLFDVLEYSSDNFFSPEPLVNSLKWEIVLPSPVISHHPIITSTPGAIAIVGVEYIYIIEATDPDGDILIYSLITAPTGMDINSNIVTWIPIEEQVGVGNFTVKVSDPSGLCVTQSFGIIVKAN